MCSTHAGIEGKTLVHQLPSAGVHHRGTLTASHRTPRWRCLPAQVNRPPYGWRLWVRLLGTNPSVLPSGAYLKSTQVPTLTIHSSSSSPCSRLQSGSLPTTAESLHDALPCVHHSFPRYRFPFVHLCINAPMGTHPSLRHWPSLAGGGRKGSMSPSTPSPSRSATPTNTPTHNQWSSASPSSPTLRLPTIKPSTAPSCLTAGGSLPSFLPSLYRTTRSHNTGIQDRTLRWNFACSPCQAARGLRVRPTFPSRPVGICAGCALLEESAHSWSRRRCYLSIYSTRGDEGLFW